MSRPQEPCGLLPSCGRCSVNTRLSGTTTCSPSVFTISLGFPTGVRIEFAGSCFTWKRCGSDRWHAFGDVKPASRAGPPAGHRLSRMAGALP